MLVFAAIATPKGRKKGMVLTKKIVTLALSQKSVRIYSFFKLNLFCVLLNHCYVNLFFE